MSLLYSNPPGRRAGNFLIPYESVDAMTWLNCLHFGGFFARKHLRHFLHLHLAHFLRLHLAHFFSSFLSHIFTFSLILKWVQYCAGILTLRSLDQHGWSHWFWKSGNIVTLYVISLYRLKCFGMGLQLRIDTIFDSKVQLGAVIFSAKSFICEYLRTNKIISKLSWIAWQCLFKIA